MTKSKSPALAALSISVALALAFPGCGGGNVRLTPSFVAVHNTMTSMGLAQSVEIEEGSIGEGESRFVRRRLRAGDCYTLVAFGADGVNDIDLVVKDERGEPVASDNTSGSQASVQFCPEADGEYEIAVRMASGGGEFVLTGWSGMPRGGAGGALAGGTGRGSCSAPIALEIGAVVSGDTSRGSHSMTGSCIRGGEAPDVVYTVTLQRRAQLSVTLTSAYDGALYLLGACGDMRSEIACNDDAPNTSRSFIEATLDPGTYYVVVDGYANEAGAYELTTQVTDLQNLAQVCAAAEALRPGQAVTGSTSGRPNYFTATCAGGARSPDRVYTLDVPARSRMRLRMQSNYDGAIYVRSDCQNPNSELACNDDHRDTRHSMLVTTLDAGRYFVYADGFSDGQSGDYSLRADLVPVTGGNAPADNCTAPGQAAAGQDIVVDTFAASDDLAGSCGGQGAPDTVYQLQVQNRVRMRARLAEGEFPAAMYIQRTCGQASTEVVCASGGPGQAELDANLQPGTYFLVVDGAAQDAFGAARVEVQFDDLAALERACQQAPQIRPGRTLTGDTSGSSDRFQATCAGGARSNDLVYRLVLTRRQRVHIQSEQQYDGAIYIRRSCADMSTEVACNDDHGDNRHSLIDTVLDRGTYYVFVDGFANNSQGSFTLDVRLSAP
ncbi:MAG: pre-peptidase C-terminal domain-containing protein [Sandaracinaceae bacterium]|nr:pre-peptidase C-terminal domain-containing protein [Sandaracinaceae bacterium]